jgi:hypothetical protein
MGFTASATTSATGYPATNISLPQVGRPWRSGDLTEQEVVLDLGASVTPESLWLQDVNFASAVVERSADNVTYSAVGTLTSYADLHGRRKGLITVSEACRYLRVTIAAGTPTDDAAYFSIGAGYVFEEVETAPQAPTAGSMDIEVNYPQSRIDLANGRTVISDLGAPYIVLSGRIDETSDEDVARLLRLARAGTIGLDLERTDRWQAWPMAGYAEQFQQASGEAVWPVSFELKEVV